MSLRLSMLLLLLATSLSAWSFDEWAANELLPRTRDLVRRHMVGARMFLTEPKKAGETTGDEESSKINEVDSSSSTSSSSSSSEEKKVKKEEVIAVTTQQPSTSSSSTVAPSTSSPSTTTSSVSSVEKKTSEEELAGKIVDVAEVLRKIADKKDKKDKSIAEVKLEKKLEKLPLIKETKTEGGVTVERVRKVTSPAPPTGVPHPATTPVAQYRRVSCDMCLKAFNGLNYNVVQMKRVAEDMVKKDCEALLYGDEEAIGACVEVMLRKIDEYYNKFEPMIATNKACVRLGMCAAHLVTNRVPQQ